MPLDADFPPIHGTYPALLDWLAARGGEQWAPALRYSPVFSEQGFEPGDEELRDVWPSGAQVSWLGGPAVDVGAWPRTEDGAALTHVATIDLADLDGTLDRAGKATWPAKRRPEGLPTSGVLQVFHDLGTFGYETEDGVRGAWAVLVSPEAGDVPRPPLVDAPEPGSAPTQVCQLMLAHGGFDLPSSLDVVPDAAGDADRLDELKETLKKAWMTQRQVGGDYAIPSTRAYGYSSHGHHAATLDVLPELLPLADGDEYRLLLEIESWTALDGWFGDAGSLEVWMRRSDLESQAFENAWCLVRTD